MRIAMLLEAFPRLSETFILRQITGLIELGHEVDIFAQQRPDDQQPVHPEVDKFKLLSHTTYMDIPPDSGYWEMPVWPITGETWLPGAETPISNASRVARALPMLFHCAIRSPRLLRKVLSPSEYGYQAESLSTAYRLGRLLRAGGRYDVIHAHYGPIGDNFRFARELWKAPLVVSFHGYDFSRWPRENGHEVYHKLFASVDAVTAHSVYAAAALRDLGCPSSKLRGLHCGVDLREFPYHARSIANGEPIRILTVGRLAPKKGIDLMIRALARVRSAYPKITYDIIGEGPMRATLEQLIDELSLNETVTLHGARETTYISEVMRNHHVFALTSRTAEDGDQEGVPVSIMEAQAAGMPVLSTYHSGIPELVLDGKSGLLAREGDLESIAAKLAQLMSQPERFPEMGRLGRAQIEQQYDLRALSVKTVAIYADAMTRFGHSRRMNRPPESSSK